VDQASGVDSEMSRRRSRNCERLRNAFCCCPSFAVGPRHGPYLGLDHTFFRLSGFCRGCARGGLGRPGSCSYTRPRRRAANPHAYRDSGATPGAGGYDGECRFGLLVAWGTRGPEFESRRPDQLKALRKRGFQLSGRHVSSRRRTAKPAQGSRRAVPAPCPADRAPEPASSYDGGAPD
jgi:hypothetical protein